MPEMTRRKRGLAVAAALVGGLIEWYDFAVYGYMAQFIGNAFFPAGQRTTSLLTALAVFGVGFLARPIGGVVIGRIGDARGRRTSLMLSIGLMAGGTVLIGVLPGYTRIGLLAPLLVVLARLMQGFAIGGEWGNAVAFLVEWAPRDRKGLYGSLNSCIALAGLPLGSGVAALVSTLLAPQQMQDWGWRLPFLLSIVLGPLGYLIRRRAEESPSFERATAARPQISVPLARAATAFGLTIAFTVGTYIFLVYMPSFTARFGHLTSGDALWANTISGLLSIVAVPFFGLLSDRIGRKPQLLACCAGFVLLSYPLFRLLLTAPGFATVLAVQLFFDLLLAALGSAVPATLAELFPVRLRSTWMSSTFALAVAIFGGFAPFIATSLVHVTGAPVAPVFYVMAAGAIGGFAASRLNTRRLDQVDEAPA